MSRELTELTRARLTALQRINAEMCPDGCGKGFELDEEYGNPSKPVHLVPDDRMEIPCTAPTIEQLADSVLLTRILIRDILHRFGANETEYDGSGGLSLLGTIDQLQEDYVRSRANEAVLAEALRVAREEIRKQLHDSNCSSRRCAKCLHAHASSCLGCPFVPQPCDCWKSRAEQRIEQALKGNHA